MTNDQQARLRAARTAGVATDHPAGSALTKLTDGFWEARRTVL